MAPHEQSYSAVSLCQPSFSSPVSRSSWMVGSPALPGAALAGYSRQLGDARPHARWPAREGGRQGCDFAAIGAVGIQLGGADEGSLSKHAVPRLQAISGRSYIKRKIVLLYGITEINSLGFMKIVLGLVLSSTPAPQFL